MTCPCRAPFCATLNDPRLSAALINKIATAWSEKDPARLTYLYDYALAELRLLQPQ